MKQLKRIISLLLCAALILGAAPTTVGAAEDASIRVSADSAYPGNWMTVYINGENLDALAALDFQIFYDSSLLSYQDFSTSDPFSSATVSVNESEDGLTISSAIPEGYSGSDCLLYLYFVVSGDAEEGTYPLEISIGDAYTSALTPYEIKSIDGTFTVYESSYEECFYSHLEPSVTDLKKGENVTVLVQNSWHYGLSAGKIELNYDSNLFRVVDAQFGSEISSNAVSTINTDRTGQVSAAFAYSSPDGTDLYCYDLLSVTLTAIEDTSATSQISCSLTELCKANRETYPNSSCETTLTLTPLPPETPTFDFSFQLPEKMILGEDAEITVYLEEGSNVAAGDFVINYDTDTFECIDVVIPKELSQMGGILVINPNQSNGEIRFSFINEEGSSAKTPVVTLTLRPVKSPESHTLLEAYGTGVKDPELNSVAIDYIPASDCIYSGTTTPADCLHAETTSYSCAACSETFSEATGKPLGHDYSHVVTDPTCTDGGYTTHSCTRCSHSYTDTPTAPLGHSMTHNEAHAATCITQGNVEYYSCSQCGNNFSDSDGKAPLTSTETKIDPTNHVGGTELRDQLTPDCTEKGYTGDIYCVSCKNVITYGEDISAYGHTEVTDKGYAPTCTEAGLSDGSHCSVCNKVLVEQKPIPENGHTKVIDKGYAPTCTEPGLSDGSHCSVCNKVLVKQEVIQENGHTKVIDPKVEPTCTETGLTEGSHCSVCNKVLVAQEVIDELGHSTKYEEGIPPTCTSVGHYGAYKCIRCNMLFADENAEEALDTDQTIPMSPHSPQKTDRVESTCTEEGNIEFWTCLECQKIFNDDLCQNEITLSDTVIGPKGHNTDEYPYVKATCTKPGNIAYWHCTVCSRYYSDKDCTAEITEASTVIQALGHDEVTDPSQTATCTSPGLTEGSHCKRCNLILIPQKETTADHTLVPIPGTPATCTSEGLTDGTKCSVCGTITVEQQDIPKLAHIEVTDEAISATCTTPGLTEGKHCTVCETITLPQEEISVLAHTLTEIPAKAATAKENGNIPYWECQTCGLNFADSNATTGLTDEEILIPATGECNGDETCVCYNMTDVKPTSWFHEAADYAVTNGLMKGTDAAGTQFSPNVDCNRAMLVTILWRLDGSPAPVSSTTAFTDLKQNWYINAVKWANENGIVTGTSATTFAPTAPVTREQMAAILYRYSTYKEYDISQTTTLNFPDADKVSGYAKAPMQWANAAGLITGTNKNGSTYLDPKGQATRAQIATILMRYIENITK